MTLSRRKFVQLSAITGAALVLNPYKIFGRKQASAYFGVNPFILANPDAVFVMRTNVDVKTNSAAKLAAGQAFGSSVFTLTDDAVNGIPLTHKVVIKPNLTYTPYGTHTSEEGMGIITDVNFVEGVIDSLKDIGIQSNQCYIREVWNENADEAGYQVMAGRTGIDYKRVSTPALSTDPANVVWKDVTNGLWFNKIPYIWPVNAPDTFLLNISKFKAHGMGMTLCAKNLQGSIAMDYQAHCTAFGSAMAGVDTAHLNPNANTDIFNNYNRHKASKIPRWDRPGSTGGIWMETWASRCMDNNSVTFAGLHIIEGIVGRDGNWFDGPDGTATDYMTNYIIFGRNQFHVDNIGHYLAGHEPGNFGLFHLAKERGQAKTINPAEIPLFSWDAVSGATSADLSSFQRYELKTYYLQRNYEGQTEDKWHMVNEPYIYSTTGVEVSKAESDEFYTLKNFPNPVIGITTIRFYIPRAGHVKTEIVDAKGQILEILTNENLDAGDHSIEWNSHGNPGGLYFYRIQYKGSVKTEKMMVLHI